MSKILKPDFTWSDIEKIEDYEEGIEKATILAKYEIDIELKQFKDNIHAQNCLIFSGTDYVPPYPK